jgi:hypothetical protein
VSHALLTGKSEEDRPSDRVTLDLSRATHDFVAFGRGKVVGGRAKHHWRQGKRPAEKDWVELVRSPPIGVGCVPAMTGEASSGRQSFLFMPLILMPMGPSPSMTPALNSQ